MGLAPVGDVGLIAHADDRARLIPLGVSYQVSIAGLLLVLVRLRGLLSLRLLQGPLDKTQDKVPLADIKERSGGMEPTKNLCAQIPVSLHAKVREEQERSGQPCMRYSTQGTATLLPRALYLAESEAPGRSVHPGGNPCNNSHSCLLNWSRRSSSRRGRRITVR